MTHYKLRALALIIIALSMMLGATLAHAKPCGRGHIAANRTCHR